ncbi:MAG: hypothetical protein E3J87_04405 [Candidatus Cloacimonadota bacterium]|nr:MAG: hypothetical protein E3J87_04405 [Candidatus Cloacimonadota bacterium]
MARLLRIDYPGAVHHIFFRGNRNENIFLDPSDRLRLLEFLSKVKNRYCVKVYAYCLVDNYVQLLLESGPIHIGYFMRDFLTYYVQSFNRRWERVGHLLQDRYKSILVDKDAYLLILIKCIHSNPVKDGLCLSPEEYLWSSHLEYLGKREPIVERDVVLSYFKDVREYEKFMREGRIEKPSSRKYKRYEFYGDEKFINKTLERISQQKRKEGCSRKELTFEDAEEFLREKFSSDLSTLRRHRDMEIKRYTVVILRDRVHYTLEEISEILGVHFTGISYIYRTSERDGILDEFDEFYNL